MRFHFKNKCKLSAREAVLHVAVMPSGRRFPLVPVKGMHAQIAGRTQQNKNPLSFMAGLASRPVLQEYWGEYVVWLAALWSGWVQYWQDGFPYLHSYKQNQEIRLWCGTLTFPSLIRLTAFSPFFSPRPLISKASLKQGDALPPL